MLSNIIIKKESKMEQLYFEFAKDSKETIIELSSEIEEALIDQMAILLIQVTKEEITENDEFTD